MVLMFHSQEWKIPRKRVINAILEEHMLVPGCSVRFNLVPWETEDDTPGSGSRSDSNDEPTIKTLS